MGEKTVPFKSVDGVHRCIKIRSANAVKPPNLSEKVVQAGNAVVLVYMNPHIRNNQDGTVIKLDLMKLVQFPAGKDSEGLECHKQTCKTRDEVQQ